MRKERSRLPEPSVSWEGYVMWSMFKVLRVLVLHLESIGSSWFQCGLVSHRMWSRPYCVCVKGLCWLERDEVGWEVFMESELRCP